MQSFPSEANKRLSCIPLLNTCVDWGRYSFSGEQHRLLIGLILGAFVLYNYEVYVGFVLNPPVLMLIPIVLLCLVGIVLRLTSDVVKERLSEVEWEYGSRWYLGAFFLVLIWQAIQLHLYVVDMYFSWDNAIGSSYRRGELYSAISTSLAVFFLHYYALAKPVVTSGFLAYFATMKKEEIGVEVKSSDPVIDWAKMRQDKINNFTGMRRSIVTGTVRFDRTKYCDKDTAEQYVFDFLQLSPKAKIAHFTMPESEELGLIESYIVHLTRAALEFGFKPSQISISGNQYIRNKDASNLSQQTIAEFFSEIASVEQERENEEIAKEQRVQVLDSMIGLKRVKEEVKRLNAMLTYNQQRQQEGLAELEQGAYHMVFTGNPGTGKTVIARLIAEMLFDKGVLKNKKVVEVTRSDLVAQYIGQTAPKVRAVVDSAMGGVLFIDEAYSLAKGGEKDFGSEAIDELLKLMEDRRGDFVVITAGYQKEMDDFLQANEGLKRRFARFIHFDDYSDDELLDILSLMAGKAGDKFEEEFHRDLPELVSQWRAAYGKGFGNAGSIRQMLEAMQKSRPLRLIEQGIEMKGDALVMLTRSDWDSAVEMTSFG
ncbi:AAA family ATPase [Shewanella nanhaiensis]|uniref:AAA family ATPase n=1 Tax=Shewanella nanhaiensis TaxID=2864872 RepID=A0ABS7E1M6_9GAMM|nr:AAA family ATPase [Shewanella nanhaiensis]MBW8183460.1 AAA family ATPase [Shewanella nanhaiensis]